MHWFSCLKEWTELPDVMKNRLADVLKEMLDNPLLAHAQSSRAQVALKAHFGATARTIRMICIMLKIPV